VAGLPGPVGPAGAPGAAGARGADVAWTAFSDITFALNKADLAPAEAEKVAQLAAYLKEHPAFYVELEGFADPRGGQNYNLKLSTRRVNAVRDALIAAGVAKEQILVAAYGALNAKCAGKGEECWQQDRRVEVIVLPITARKSASLRNGK
jgi:outer membrane protein OmpA-like peptidoglycan-associated protein